MNLSEHFTIEQLIASNLAARKGIDNFPPSQAIDNLKRVAERLEEVQKLLQHPLSITSGFRCSALNKLVGSKPNSKHVQGLAADFTCPVFGNPKQIVEKIRDSNLIFDRCILEFYNPTTGDGWVHIDVGNESRKMILTINSFGTFNGVYV